MKSRYDLVVIGGGTAGLVSTAGAASLGARVALVERDKLGGDCLYYGCVPTKTLVKSARVAALVRRADEIAVDGGRLSTRSVIVATGSHSITPPISGLEEAGYLTHVEALQLERLPRSVMIVGSGPIGSEFAQIFARFGCKVEMISSSPLPLPKEDPEVGDALKRFLLADGATFHGGFRAEEARVENGEKVLKARDGQGREIEVRGEEILIAAGRAATVGGLGLENAGVELGKEGLKVDEKLGTTAQNVFAAGDITGKYLFTHVAEYQARTAVRNALFPLKANADHRVVPWTTFTDPEVARVGLTEEQARERYTGVKIFRHPFEAVDRAIADGETDGFVKVVADKRGKILGGHIIGPDAGNLIHEIVLAMRKNIRVQGLSTTIHVYPTLSQANQRAADEYYREKLFTDRNRRLLSAFFGARRLLARN